MRGAACLKDLATAGGRTGVWLDDQRTFHDIRLRRNSSDRGGLLVLRPVPYALRIRNRHPGATCSSACHRLAAGGASGPRSPPARPAVHTGGGQGAVKGGAGGGCPTGALGGCSHEAGRGAGAGRAAGWAALCPLVGQAQTRERLRRGSSRQREDGGGYLGRARGCLKGSRSGSPRRLASCGPAWLERVKGGPLADTLTWGHGRRSGSWLETGRHGPTRFALSVGRWAGRTCFPATTHMFGACCSLNCARTGARGEVNALHRAAALWMQPATGTRRAVRQRQRAGEVGARPDRTALLTTGPGRS